MIYLLLYAILFSLFIVASPAQASAAPVTHHPTDHQSGQTTVASRSLRHNKSLSKGGCRKTENLQVYTEETVTVHYNLPYILAY